MRRVCRLALLVCMVVSGSAHADDAELARQRFETGKLLYKRASFSDALKEFEAAHASFDNVLLDYNIGLCLEALGRRFEAADAFQRFAEGSSDTELVNDTWHRIAKLRKPLPDAPQQLRDTWRARARTLRLVGIGLAGLGAGGLLAALPVGLQALDERDAYRRSCTAGLCDADAFHRAHALGAVDDGILGVGITLTIAGITLIGVATRRVHAPVVEPVKGIP